MIASISAGSASGLQDDLDGIAERDLLSAHMRHCNSTRGFWFSVRCLADSFDDFVGSRFVTTLSIATLAICAAMMVL